MSTIWPFDNIENKHILDHAEDCMKNFCSSLRDNATNVINFEKKKLLPLTKRELKLHWDVTACYICGKRFSKKFAKDINYRRVRDHCHFTCKYRGAAHIICSSKFNLPKEILVVFHNELWLSLYDERIRKRDSRAIRKPWRKYRKVQNIFHSNRKRS